MEHLKEKNFVQMHAKFESNRNIIRKILHSTFEPGCSDRL